MNVTTIRPNPKAANWIEIREAGSYVTVSRVNADGERLQTLSLMPDEVSGLIAALAAQEAA